MRVQLQRRARPASLRPRQPRRRRRAARPRPQAVDSRRQRRSASVLESASAYRWSLPRPRYSSSSCENDRQSGRTTSWGSTAVPNRRSVCSGARTIPLEDEKWRFISSWNVLSFLSHCLIGHKVGSLHIHRISNPLTFPHYIASVTRFPCTGTDCEYTSMASNTRSQVKGSIRSYEVRSKLPTSNGKKSEPETNDKFSSHPNAFADQASTTTCDGPTAHFLATCR